MHFTEHMEMNYVVYHWPIASYKFHHIYRQDKATEKDNNWK